MARILDALHTVVDIAEDIEEDIVVELVDNKLSPMVVVLLLLTVLRVHRFLRAHHFQTLNAICVSLRQTLENAEIDVDLDELDKLTELSHVEHCGSADDVHDGVDDVNDEHVDVVVFVTIDQMGLKEKKYKFN